MMKFQKLFGIDKNKVKKNCVLMPFLFKEVLNEFAIKNFMRGVLYGTGNNDYFTLIHTGVGAGFLGDAVLYLKDTACKNLILFGSCGALPNKNGIDIGSVVLPYKAYNYDSFVDMLLKKKRRDCFYPHSGLTKDFLAANPLASIKKVSCVTISSLKLEEENTDLLKKNGAEVVDMECAAFFASAGFIRRKAMALFYVADIIKEKPFYSPLCQKDKFYLAYSIQKASSLLYDFIKNNLHALNKS